MKTLAWMILAAWFFAPYVHAGDFDGERPAEKCVPRDLRDSTLAPLHSQYADGWDTGTCAAFSTAVVASLYLRTDVSPEALAIDTYRGWEGADGWFAWLAFDSDSNTNYARNVAQVLSAAGACSTRKVSTWASANHPGLNAMEALYREANQPGKRGRDLGAKLEEICGERTPVHLAIQESSPVHGGGSVQPSIEERQELIRSVDFELDHGRAVIAYNTIHYVAVVGRTPACEYVIQDSVPQEIRQKEKDYPASDWTTGKEPIRFENGYAIWPRGAFAAFLLGIGRIAP